MKLPGPVPQPQKYACNLTTPLDVLLANLVNGTHPIRIGIMGCSAFARRAMIPALRDAEDLVLCAVASRFPEKARETATTFGCGRFCSYEELLDDPAIDAIYMPLPTGLHGEWVGRCLSAGKHLLVEKSLALDATSAARMVAQARASGLLLMENFLFLRHNQTEWVKNTLASGLIGALRLFRAAFTIPSLEDGNFRYDSSLGGGALLDVGAYMAKSSLFFLGEKLELLAATIDTGPNRQVDVFGTATFRNAAGVVAQTVWAFDAQYQCTWEFLGTQGRIICERALTAPPGLHPPVRIETGASKQNLELPADNHYKNQWEFFASAVRSPSSHESIHKEILLQARVMEAIRTESR